jgi:hypothetical protein
MMTEFFTRLTPNFNDWKKPSGRDGKCKAADSTKPLYEETHGFGWEEWLFEEYFQNISNPEYVCKGFIEAFNKKNKSKGCINRLYLYTKVCVNKQGYRPGCYFVGYIDNVLRVEPAAKNQKEVQIDLKLLEKYHKGVTEMLPFAKNISFKVKDVHVRFPMDFKHRIQLKQGQFRFALYDINNHPNFLSELDLILTI